MASGTSDPGDDDRRAYLDDDLFDVWECIAPGMFGPEIGRHSRDAAKAVYFVGAASLLSLLETHLDILGPDGLPAAIRRFRLQVEDHKAAMEIASLGDDG